MKELKFDIPTLILLILLVLSINKFILNIEQKQEDIKILKSHVHLLEKHLNFFVRDIEEYSYILSDSQMVLLKDGVYLLEPSQLHQLVLSDDIQRICDAQILGKINDSFSVISHYIYQNWLVCRSDAYTDIERLEYIQGYLYYLDSIHYYLKLQLYLRDGQLSQKEFKEKLDVKYYSAWMQQKQEKTFFAEKIDAACKKFENKFIEIIER